MKKRYDLNGGLLGCCGTAKAPLKRGFYFNKWHSDGYKYIAEWAESKLTDNVTVDTTYFGGDDGLTSPASPVIIPVKKGANGEDVYTVKTVYTDIVSDGNIDKALTKVVSAKRQNLFDLNLAAINAGFNYEG